MKKSLLVVSQFFMPEKIGGASRMWDLTNSLKKWFYITVLCPPPSFPYGDFKKVNKLYYKEKLNGIKVCRLWTYQPGKNPNKILRMLNYFVFSFLSFIWVFLKGWKYDIVFTTTPTTLVGLSGFAAKALYRKVWILDVRDPWLRNAVKLGYLKRNTVTFKLGVFIEKRNWSKPDMLTILSETLRNDITGFAKDTKKEIFVFPHMIDTKFFKPMKIKKREQIIYAGNIGMGQSLEEFIKAVKIVLKKHKIKFKLVGGGENLENLKKLSNNLNISEFIEFSGSVPRKEIPKLISESLIGVIPLKQDIGLDYAVPIKLLECMSCGTPFISSKIYEIEKIAKKSKAGIVVDNDPEKIADVICKLLKNRRKLKTMGKNGRDFIIKNYSMENISNSLYDKIKAITK